MQGCRPLHNAEVDQLLASDLSPRDKLLLLTGLYFGTRISETLSLTFGDVATGYLHIKSKKGSNNVVFNVPHQYATEVESLKAEYLTKGVTVTATTPLFLSRQGDQRPINRTRADQIMHEAKRRVGLEGKINTHSLRKTFVTRIYELSGRDIAQTKKYSRHKNLANLDYYIGTCEDLNLVNQLSWGTPKP